MNLDHVGPKTKTVKDAALMHSVLIGFDPHDPASIDIPISDFLSHINEGVKGWQMAMVDGEFLTNTDNEVIHLVKSAAQVFIDMGAKVESVEMDWLGDMAKANSQITQADAAAYHRDRLNEHPDWFGEDVRQRLETGKALTSTEYSLARQIQDEGRHRLEMLFTKYDLLLLPTTPMTAPEIEGINGVEAARLLTRFTAPFNLAGSPALSIPCGFTRAGLPVGLQLVTRGWREDRLLLAGHAYETATAWGSRHPNF
jgi:aspartyl-tRNA(Asn)/glutamyl-tRNA(Gln) amidotransferase subunit A